MDVGLPFSAFKSRVKPEWIDYNGHMNVGFYVMAFDQATDCFLEHIGMGARYARQTRCSAFVVDMNVTYRRELHVGDPIRCATQLLETGDKKLRIFHQMFHDEEGWLAATNELLLIHVDLEARKSLSFPAQVRDQLGELAFLHSSLELPEGAGRVLGL